MTSGSARLPSPGDLIGGRYLVDGLLGEGGMAVVYRARHTGTDRACALKFIRPQLAEEPKQREQFLREARVAGRIGSHPHIVDVFDTGLDEQRGAPFIAMELLEGEPLNRHLKRMGPLPWPTVREMLEQIADALDTAHGAGVVHRDLKPGNVFVTQGRKGALVLKVLDFGIAKFTEGLDNNQTATQIGTPWYSAPEQLGASMRQLAADRGIAIAPAVSPATDVWAIALIAYELLTGLSPKHYWGSQTLVDQLVKLTLEARVAPTQRSGERARYLPAGFDDWFLCCTQHDATRRYQSVGAAVDALDALLQAPSAVPWVPAAAMSDRGRGLGALGPATPASGQLASVPSGSGPLLASGPMGASGPMAASFPGPPSGPWGASGAPSASGPHGTSGAMGPSGAATGPAPWATGTPGGAVSAAQEPPATGPHGMDASSASGPLQTSGVLGQSGPLGASGPLATSGRFADTAGSWQQDAALRPGRSRAWIGVVAVVGVVGLGAAAGFLLVGRRTGGGGPSDGASSAPAAATGAPTAAEGAEPSATASDVPEPAEAKPDPSTTADADAGEPPGEVAAGTPTRTTPPATARTAATRPATTPAGAATKTKGGDGNFDDLFGKR